MTATNGAASRRIAGLYAVTPDLADTALLVALVRAAIEGGAAAVQYRNKAAAPALALALEQASALVAACRAGGVPLIVNDDWRLAVRVGADGVHVGGDDGNPREVRAAIGPAMLLGVSCYDRFELAEAVDGVADQVAFGSVFSSGTKPAAVRAPLELLGRAKARGWNVVAIGGIDVRNARQAIEAGADAVAVIRALFATSDPRVVEADTRAVTAALSGR
mgnify:CR=1 FL=1